MNDRIKKAGIEIIGRYRGYNSPPVMLKYKGKTIERPEYDYCVRIILKEFGIKI